MDLHLQAPSGADAAASNPFQERYLSSASALKFRGRTHFCLHTGESLLWWWMQLKASSCWRSCCYVASLFSLSSPLLCFECGTHLQGSSCSPLLISTPSPSSRQIVPIHMCSVSYTYSQISSFFLPFLTLLAACVTLHKSSFPLLIPTMLISHQVSILKAFSWSSISAFRRQFHWFSPHQQQHPIFWNLAPLFQWTSSNLVWIVPTIFVKPSPRIDILLLLLSYQQSSSFMLTSTSKIPKFTTVLFVEAHFISNRMFIGFK